jgi:restriction endonuclease S subunit
MIDEFLNLEIPLPSLDIQKKIVQTWDNIKNEIERLENENKNLDEEVDKYLMKEL